MAIASVRGADYSWGRPQLSAAKAAGVTFVSRYLSWNVPSQVGKVITPGERDQILGAGIDIFANWEYDAKDALGGSAAGAIIGKAAAYQAAGLGYPRGACLFNSADWDVSDSEKAVVGAHFAALRPEYRARGYLLGAYGSYWLLKYLFDHNLIDEGWQTYAWSGGYWDSRARLRQVQNGVKIGGADCDWDVMYGQVPSWKHPTGTAVPVTNPGNTVEDDMKDKILIQDGAGGAVYVGSVGGVYCRQVANVAALKNEQFWIAKRGGDPTVNTFVKGTYVDVIGPAAPVPLAA